MIENVLDFVQNILAGHWAINILVLITLVITFVAAVVSSDVESISKPLKQRTVWLLWLFGGLWGIQAQAENPVHLLNWSKWNVKNSGV